MGVWISMRRFTAIGLCLLVAACQTDGQNHISLNAASLLREALNPADAASQQNGSANAGSSAATDAGDGLDRNYAGLPDVPPEQWRVLDLKLGMTQRQVLAWGDAHKYKYPLIDGRYNGNWLQDQVEPCVRRGKHLGGACQRIAFSRYYRPHPEKITGICYIPHGINPDTTANFLCDTDKGSPPTVQVEFSNGRVSKIHLRQYVSTSTSGGPLKLRQDLLNKYGKPSYDEKINENQAAVMTTTLFGGPKKWSGIRLAWGPGYQRVGNDGKPITQFGFGAEANFIGNDTTELDITLVNPPAPPPPPKPDAPVAF